MEAKEKFVHSLDCEYPELLLKCQNVLSWIQRQNAESLRRMLEQGQNEPSNRRTEP